MDELLRRFWRPYRAKTTLAVMSKTVEVVFEVLTPLVIAHMIDAGVMRNMVDEVLRSGLLLVVFAGVSYSSTFVCQRLAAQVSQGMGTDIRDALFTHVMGLSLPQVNSFGTPSLITRVTNDVNQVQLAVALAIRLTTRWPLLALGSMVAAVTIDATMGLVFVVCLPTIFAVFGFVMRASAPYFRAMQQRLDHISLVLREMLFGMRVIRAFRREEAEDARAREAVEDQAAVAIAQGRLSAILNPATFLIMNAGICAILLLGAERVDAGTLTRGEVMAFVSYMTQALLAVTVMTNLVVVLMRAQTSSVRIMEVLDAKPEMEVLADAVPTLATDAPGVPALELESVSFAYGAGMADAVSDVSLTLEQGHTLGVIGGTGSGKSTLANLIVRLTDAREGRVRLFGVDLDRITFAELRRAVSIVPQDVSLVSGTIRSNLTWRQEEASDDELWRALELAQADAFVRELPQGLDAPVEAAGRNFSGGQRQRLTIARALVGHPSLVVLDDAASALDFATDAALRRALRTLQGELTCVIVSQRVSAVMHADAILVLDHGRQAGLGTHVELLETCEIYREICASQLKREPAGELASGTVRLSASVGEVMARG